MKKAILFLVLLFALVVAATLLRPRDEDRGAQTVTGLPWQIEILADGKTRVFGLTPGSSTFGAATGVFGADREIALVAAQGETGTLEAYFNQVTTGIIGGKMVLSADLDRESVERMRQRAVKSEYMESSTRKFALHPDDLALAENAPIASITFIPAARLDEAIVLSRFGQPGERIRASETMEHFLYPDKGLALTLDREGKEILQYVAPAQFARLRDPLVARGAK